MKTVPIAKPLLDYTIYPRAQVDSQHVHYMRQALKSGASLPPIIVCKKSLRVVDGFHRLTAMRLEFGDESTIEVIEKSYASEKELFLDAIRLNAPHGRRLTTFDRAHCLIIAKDLRIAVADIASAMSMTVDALGELRTDRVGELRVSGGQNKPIALKRTIRHMAEKPLTDKQSAANDKLSGMQQSFYVNQVILLLENNLLDRSDENLLERLGVLHGLLEGELVSA